MDLRNIGAFVLMLLLVVGVSEAINIGDVLVFDNCGATGRYGPSQSECDSAYSGTNLANDVSIIGSGIQEWTVPTTGTYRITAYGAQGGDSSGGLGAILQGDFLLNEGELLEILVGQQGGNYNPDSTGGGGGTFVANSGASTINDLLIAAGGGGGGINRGQYPGDDASFSESNSDGNHVNGEGGDFLYGYSAGGGGYLYDGGGDGSGLGGHSFVNGGVGGYDGEGTYSQGGFGGGGGHGNGGNNRAGGGGGYTGGDGGENTENHEAGGGGSFNSGSNPVNEVGLNSGHGKVEIELLSVANSVPDVPSNPFPSDGATEISRNLTLSVTVTDSDGDPMDVSFYDSSNTLIGTDSGVASGSTASVNWSCLSYDTTYNWYVVVDDGSGTTQSATWIFTTVDGIPKSDNFTNNETTNFSDVDVTNVSDPVIADNGDKAKVEWKGNFDLSGADLDSNIKMKDNFIEVNSAELTQLNTTANVTFKTVSYPGTSAYQVIKNGEVCSDCKKHSSNPVKFSVNGFSNYTTEQSGNIPEFNGLAFLIITLVAGMLFFLKRKI